MPSSGGVLGAAKAGIEEFTLRATASGGTTYTQALAPGCTCGANALRLSQIGRVAGAQGSAGLWKTGRTRLNAALATSAFVLASRLRALLLAATTSGLAGLVRQAQKPLALNAALPAMALKSSAKSLPTGVISAPLAWAARVRILALACAASMATQATRQAQKLLGGQSPTASGVSRGIGKTVAALPTLLVGVLTGNARSVLLSVAAATLPAQTRQALTNCAASAVSQTSQSLATAKALLGANLALARVSAGRLLFQTLTVAIVCLGIMQKRPGKRVMATPANSAGIGKFLRRAVRALAGSSARGALVALYARGLTAAQMPLVTRALAAGKTFAVGQAANILVSKASARALAATCGASAFLAQTCQRVVVLAATCAANIGQIKALARVLPLQSAPVGVALTRQAGKMFAPAMTVAYAFGRLWMKTLAPPAVSPAALARGAGKLLTLAPPMAAGVFKTQARSLLAVSVGAAQMARASLKIALVSLLPIVQTRAGRLKSILLAAQNTPVASLLNRAKTRLVILAYRVTKQG